MTTTAPTTAPAQGTGEIQEAGHVDVLIVGAGVSGIGAAHHLREEFPDRTFVILDAQDNRGGTWWTHRYPGVRSDSDLFTYGYRFKPWRGPSIAVGEEILAYLDEVLEEKALGNYTATSTGSPWPAGPPRTAGGPSRSPGTTPGSSCGSPPASCGCARATTTTPSPTGPSGTASTASRARSCTRSGGRRSSTWRASASS